MERIPKAVYTPEFRTEALKLVEVEGLSVGQAAKRLSLPKASLSNWVRASLAATSRWNRGLHVALNWIVHARHDVLVEATIGIGKLRAE